MANFKYTAISSNGEKIEGVINSLDRDTAIIELKDTVMTVTSIKEVQETPKFLEGLFKPKIDEKNLALVCQQLSIILNAGLPITLAIKLVADQTQDKYLKSLLINVAEDVKGGSTLAAAFEKRDNRLPSTFIEPIRAGETGGNIDSTFERLSTYFGNKSNVAEKVKSALIYPAFVIALGVIVVAVIMVVAVPMFTDTFAEMGIDLPFPTRALIAMSNFTINWLWLFVLIVAILAIAYFVYRNTEKGHYITDQWKLHTPMLGNIRMMTAASEFANAFSIMLASGLPAVKALRITGKTLTNYSIGQDVMDACGLVEGGYRIGTSIKKTTNLPDLLIEVTGIGEQSGQLEKTLRVIGDYYDREAQGTTDRAIKVLEPSIIIVLAVFVVFILLAVYLPMFSMYGNM